MTSRAPIRRSKALRGMFARALRRGLVLLLALLATNVPVPLVHQHDVNSGQVKRSTALSKHVDRFHARSARTGHGQRQLGWHFHFMMPWQISQGSSNDVEQEFEPVVLSSASSADVDAAFNDVCVWTGEFGSVLTPCWSTIPVTSQVAGRQFFSTYGCSVAIGDLVSVRVC